MCFGLGEGMAVWFMYFPGLSPSRIVHVRTIDLESQFFDRIGHPFEWEIFDTPEHSERGLRAKIDDGLPVILRTDLYHLPYYASKTHYPGHVITVWGYDSDREIFFVTDTERKDLLEVSLTTRPDFSEAAGKLDQVVEQEELYHRKVLAVFG
jgi:hypothetical protein